MQMKVANANEDSQLQMKEINTNKGNQSKLR